MEIIDWLCGVEEKVSDIYGKAAMNFSADATLAELLRTLSDQELRHSRMIREAFDGRDLLKEEELAAIVDGETRHTVNAALDGVMAKVCGGGLSREEMTEIVADTEYYEWNGIFLYAMHVLKGSDAQYAVAKAEIDTHLQVIEEFLVTFPYGQRVLERLRRLPTLGRLKVLVVEDDPALAGLIKNILKREAEVIVAANGRQGLELLRVGTFDAIISDVDLPAMDGIDLYKQALCLDQSLQERFVFLSANPSLACRHFFAARQLTVLRKPSSINRIRQAVLGVSEGRRVAFDF